MSTIAAGALLVALLAAPVAPARAAQVVVRHGVKYGMAEVALPAPGRSRLLLDLYRPARATRAPRPVVIAIHGGAFRRGSRADPHIVRIARGLAARGAVVASIDYRLLGQEPITSADGPRPAADTTDTPLDRGTTAAVDDTLSAIDYLRAHALRLRIDLGRLGLVGASAGAITADNIAFVLGKAAIGGPRPRFVASLWGGIPHPSAVARPAEADRLRRGTQALFAVHGSADTQVPVRLSDDLVARARAAGLRTEYHRVASHGHGFHAMEFFRLAVRGRQTAFQRLLAFASSALRLAPAERCRRPAVRELPDASRRRCQYPARGAARNVIAGSRRAAGPLGRT